ncbi:MAG TPA: hypothetical protein QF838_07950 [SAR202 cluster bacterium]|jgi:dienelactone hydrolase|nr:hypothetical protein [SAR202 cluster bacterium]|tara:strand:+ start:377 stop:1516 length:1140 start_codon:yes stop_codon:yes gene_type:complete
MRKSIKIPFLVIFLVLLLLITPQARASFKAALFIPQILPAIPIKPLEYVSGTPTRLEITFESSKGFSEADIYLPSGNGTHPGVVFFMGIVPPDREEKRILALAEGLARTGMVVLIPWLETQAENRLVVDDIETLVDAFLYLQEHERVDGTRVGMGGICTGASMAVVAAQSNRINEEVTFVNLFAGYYDAFDLVKSTASETRFNGDSESPWVPDNLTKNMVNNHLIHGAEPDDRNILLKIMENGTWNQNQYDSLSSSGKSVLTLLGRPSLDEAKKAITNLNAHTADFLKKISPSSNIDMLKADVLLMHDLQDRLVPAEESRRLARAVRSNGGEVYHTEFSLFQNSVKVHTTEADETGKLNFIKQAFKLYRHMHKVMSLSG